MVRGKGSYLWDTDGKRYLDFVQGWAVNCLGHCPPVLARALSRQARQLVNASPALYNDRMIQVAALLTKHSCLDKVFFANSGAEANEGAVKLARKYGAVKLGGAYEIVTAWNGFHGRTLAMMAASGKKGWDGLFEPKVPGFVRVPFNDLDAMRAAVSPGQNLRRDARARAGRGRRLRRGRGVFARGAPAVRRARRAAHPRRDPDGDRPHRDLVRLRAIRDRTGHHDPREGARRRLSRCRPAGQERRLRFRAGRPRRNLLRSAAGDGRRVCGRQRGHREAIAPESRGAGPLSHASSENVAAGAGPDCYQG